MKNREKPPSGGMKEKTEKPVKIRGIKRTTFAVPYLALSIIFVVVPLFIMLYYAFTDGSGHFSFSNFGHFFSRPNIMLVMGRSRCSLPLYAFYSLIRLRSHSAPPH